jgi:hypothetical protein
MAKKTIHRLHVQEQEQQAGAAIIRVAVNARWECQN